MKKKSIIYLGVLLLVITVFFRQVVFNGRVPIPTDTLVFLFNPYRDYYSSNYPRGVPYKNPIVSDPVVQQIPFRSLSVDMFKAGQLPLWNPYQMGGYPLLGNIQAASFYPLNFLFFILPFTSAWTLLIILQPFLAGIFMFFYLKNRNLLPESSLFGAIAFSFSGFFIAWLEWGTIVHTALWLPLMLLAVDNIIKEKGNKWFGVLGIATLSSFFGGHLQTFIYSIVIVISYFLFMYWHELRKKRILILLSLTAILVILIALPVWLTQIKLIGLSARDIDQSWQKLGWFIPLAQLIQFFAPDFFGNPATGNYWGVFNYGEFIGYVGIAPLLFALVGIFSGKRKEVLLWGVLGFLAILMSTQNPIAELPYHLSIPFFSSTQPTRLIFIVDVALVIMAAVGFDMLLRAERRITLTRLLEIIGGVALIVYGFIFLSYKNFDPINFAVTQRNLIVPSGLFLLSSLMIIVLVLLSKKRKIFPALVIIAITGLDLLFFAGKYTPFGSKEFFYPTTNVIKFLKNQPGQFRIMTTSRQLLAPNISTMYKLQSVDGYDPLYLLRYGQLISANERGKADISPPYGFNRIIVPTQFNSRIINLMGVRYVLSLTDRDTPQLKKVYQEGETRIYENKDAFPRVFFVQHVQIAPESKKTIEKLLDSQIDLHTVAIVEDTSLNKKSFSTGEALISSYSENNIIVKTETQGESFLVFTDTYYPSWKVKVDNIDSKIYRTDFNFRGVVVPKGIHTVEFTNTLL